MKEFPRKFLSLRDKNGAHHRSKSVPPGNKAHRPLSAEAFRSIFKIDQSKQQSQSEPEKTKPEDAKIEQVQHRLSQLHITGVADDHIKHIMTTNFASGDVERTAEFIEIEHKAGAGIIMPYNPSVHMVGAENRGAVTCYLDSLLFAMFSKLDAFECMLQNEYPPEDPKGRLATLLRIWVNMLRTGKLVRTDMTKLIQDSLAECGWSDAQLLEQQDTSEAFAFLTETLQLPLLSLQVDLFHQGKKDKDDHKVVYERLLNLAVPPDSAGKGVKLEDCLEEYFNAQVDVLRDSEESKKSFSEDKGSDIMPPLLHRTTLRLVRGEENVTANTITASPVDILPSPIVLTDALEKASLPSPSQDSIPEYGSSEDATTQLQNNNKEGGSDVPNSSQRRPGTRHRSTSVIQRVMLDDQGRPTSANGNDMRQRTRRKGSTVIKAVTIPAWQFFRLIPWHAISSNGPRNDVEVAMNFDQRPVVGICLKRYAMTESGQPKRHNTFIDIPVSLRLPHFMLADGPSIQENLNGLSTEYKLVLQSIVCHRGDSLQSGHYIAFSRVEPKLLTNNRRHDFDPPPDYEEAQWVKFDDLEIENRVTYIDDIRKAMTEEMPYLLFYQIVPMVDIICSSPTCTDKEPPSYNDSKASMETPRKVSYETPAADLGGLFQPQTPSIRLSFDVERPSRKFFEGLGFGTYAGSTPASRRQSMALTDSATGTPTITPAITPDPQSPVMAPLDDSSSSRLSRAATRFALGKQSRSQSQTGEGRINTTMSRLGLIKTSKEPSSDPHTLNQANTNTAGKKSFEESNQVVLDSPIDEEKLSSQSQSNIKQGHKRGKSKEKSGKRKSSEQPERECIVM